MKTQKQWTVLILSVTLIALLAVGLVVANPTLAQGPGSMMGGYGSYGGNMMGYTQGYSNTLPAGGYGYGSNMMGGGMMGMGMMGGYGSMFNGGLFASDPLTLTDATDAVKTYLDTLGDSNLALGEVMVFDNHAYAEIVETDTGIGAMEVLVDPVTKSVYPEMGPNMMWNLKYGMMAGFGGYGMMGMMGGYGYGNTTPTDIPADMPVSADEAVKIAQSYLDNYVPGNLNVETRTDPFYGYYTIHVTRNDNVVGMLSVNGFTRQVFLHTWHGNFIEMSAE